MQAVLELPSALQHAVVRAAVCCTLPPMTSLHNPQPYGFMRVLTPNAHIADLLLRQLPPHLHAAVFSALRVRPFAPAERAAATPGTSRADLAYSCAGLAPAGGGAELYLPLAGLSVSGAQAIASVLHNADDGTLASITSASLPLYEGGAPKPCHTSTGPDASCGCGVSAALPLLAPLHALTRLMLQGSPPQPKGLDDRLTQANMQLPPFRKGYTIELLADRVPAASAVGSPAAPDSKTPSAVRTQAAKAQTHGHACAGDSEAPCFDGVLPHLRHLELHGCSSAMACAIIDSALPSIRLLAVVDMPHGGPPMLQRVSQMTRLQAKSISRSFGSVGADKLCDLLLCYKQLRYLSIAQCSILPATMGRLGAALRALPSLQALDASALQQDAVAEADAGAMGDLMVGIAGCTALQVRRVCCMRSLHARATLGGCTATM